MQYTHLFIRHIFIMGILDILAANSVFECHSDKKTIV